jgi:hypothetical protein
MRMGLGALTIWSFLVATAHGAGLMVLPIWVNAHGANGGHAAHMPAAVDLGAGLTATAVHSISYLLVTTRWRGRCSPGWASHCCGRRG